MFGSLYLSSSLLLSILCSTAAASHTSKQAHRTRSVRSFESSWTALQESSVVECAGLREEEELEGLVVCYKRILDTSATSKIVDQLVVLQYSSDGSPVEFSAPLQLSWSDKARRQTSPFVLKATNPSLSVVSHTLHFLHDSSSTVASPVITFFNSSQHLVTVKTPSRSASIPSDLPIQQVAAITRSTKAALRIQRRQESESLLLAPSTTARRGRPSTTGEAPMNVDSAAAMTMDVPTTETRGPRPRTSTEVDSTSIAETSSASAQADATSFEHQVEYSIHSGREMSVEMVPYGLVAVASVLGIGCLVVAYSAFSRRALRKEYREGQLAFAEKQGQF